VMASRGIAGRLTDTIGARWVTFTGLVVTAIATVPFAFVGTETSEWWLAVVLVVRGVGLGAVTIPVMASPYQGLDRAPVPHASSIPRTAQQIGGSFGTAVLAVSLERAVAAHAAGGAAGRATAFDIAFWWSVVFTVVAVVVALWLPTRRREPATG